jgi:hypothetical protein
MTTKKVKPVEPTTIPSRGRADKRARFTPEEKKEHRGASPLVLVAGILIVLLLIGGVAVALPRLSPSASAGQGGPAVDTGSAAVLSKPTTTTPSTQQGSAASQNPGPVEAATLGHDPYPLAAAEDGAVRLPLSTFDDYKAHFYTYMVNGRPVEFFVVKSQDGVVRAAFNACDVCFQAKLGYRQEGDVMICNNCGRRFPTDQVNEVQGGCNPSPLSRTISGDSILILDTDLAQGLSFF